MEIVPKFCSYSYIPLLINILNSTFALKSCFLLKKNVFLFKTKKYMDYSNKTYKELVKEEDELKEEFNLMLDSCAKEGLSFLEFCDRAKYIK